MTLAGAGTRYCFWHLVMQLHIEAIGGPVPPDDAELCRLMLLRRAQIAAYARWLTRYAEPVDIRERWEEKGENN